MFTIFTLYKDFPDQQDILLKEASPAPLWITVRLQMYYMDAYTLPFVVQPTQSVSTTQPKWRIIQSVTSVQMCLVCEIH